MFRCSEDFNRLRKVHSVKGWSGSRLGRGEECESCPLLCISEEKHSRVFEIKLSKAVGKK